MRIRSHLNFICGRWTTLLALAIGTAIGAAHAQNIAPAGADENEKSEAGVRATEDHWELAEVTGDTDYLTRMLVPGYRSVNPNGEAHSKEMIIAGAAKNRGSDEAKRKTEAYLKEHPSGASVMIEGSIAVVSFYDPSLGPQKGVRSSDVFTYTDGAWHAAYSQHADVGKK
jgi:hypothetical protein